VEAPDNQKETINPMEEDHSLHDHAKETETQKANKWHWVMPDSWTEAPAGRMVKARYVIGSGPEIPIELTISAFPGSVGSPLSNLNRWRGQVGLGPISEDLLPDFLTDLEIHHLPAYQADVIGPELPNYPSKRILVTAIQRQGETWFFKLTGDASQIGNRKAEYLDFIQSLQPH